MTESEPPGEIPDGLTDELAYQFLCANVELKTVRLVGATAQLQPVQPPGSLDVALSIEVSGQHAAEDGLVYQVVNTVEIVSQEVEVYTAVLTYVVGYTTTLTEVPENLIQAFGEKSVLLTVAPFVRHEVYHLTGEAGLPPVLLGLFKVPQSGPQSD